MKRIPAVAMERVRNCTLKHIYDLLYHVSPEKYSNQTEKAGTKSTTTWVTSRICGYPNRAAPAAEHPRGGKKSCSVFGMEFIRIARSIKNVRRVLRGGQTVF